MDRRTGALQHPSESTLALFAGGELGMLDRWWTGRHVRNCSRCEAHVASFASIKSDLAEAVNALPANLNWDALAAEMTANIHVGLEASQCIAPVVRRSQPLGWKAAAVLASVTALLMTAWWLNIPRPAMKADSEVVLKVNHQGIGIEQNGTPLIVLHTRALKESKPVYTSGPGTLRARYVDADTGQVTINNVYSQ
jgi:hypothetical protein